MNRHAAPIDAAALKAGIAYVGSVFPCAFFLGTIRVLQVAPRVGELPAVMLEIPVVLLISAFFARWCARRFQVQPAAAPLLQMGGIAFVLLMLLELSLSLTLFGASPQAYLATFGTAAGALGLAGQLGFAAMPWLLCRR